MTRSLQPPHSSACTGSGLDNWRTPPELLDAIEARFRVWLAFDTACTPEDRIHTAVSGSVGLAYDGLGYDWRPIADSIGEHNTGRRTIALWCHPPYSQVAAWMAKCRHEAHIHRTRIFALVPVRTDTDWWNDSVHLPAHVPYGAAKVVLLRGRLQFLPPADAARVEPAEAGRPVKRPSSWPFPAALVIYEPGHAGPPAYEVWNWRRSPKVRS